MNGAIPTKASKDSTSIRAENSADFVLLGGPGSGKGTQASFLHKKLGGIHLSTGDLFREHLAKETPLGTLARGYIDQGQLVPDEVTSKMVAERLTRPDAEKGAIFDGFPRTLNQAKALDDILSGMGRQLSGVLYINVSDEEIIRRLSGRLICRNCQTPYHRDFSPPAQADICDKCGGELYQRSDDNPDAIRIRLHTFHKQTKPLVDYYLTAGRLVEVDGVGDVSTVSQRSLAAVQKLSGD